MRLITHVMCPKCQKRGAKRIGYSEDKSLWSCESCGNRFEVQILKLKK